VATSPFNMTSDADGTATEICDAIRTDLTSSTVDDYLALGGTATVTLTMTAGYTANVVSTGVGVLATATTTAYANDHVNISTLHKSIKFSRTITAAGSCGIQF
jgi:hypothetical protein